MTDPSQVDPLVEIVGARRSGRPRTTSIGQAAAVRGQMHGGGTEQQAVERPGAPAADLPPRLQQATTPRINRPHIT